MGHGAAAVAEALADGPAAATTQLAVLAAGGDMAGVTGAGCVPHVGEELGERCRCQANMMAAEGCSRRWPTSSTACRPGDAAAPTVRARLAGDAPGTA